MGTAHKDLSEAHLHEPKGVSTATAGQTYVANGAGSGTWAAAGGANTVIINVLADFPTPAGGFHQLVANTNYVLANTSEITTADYFKWADGATMTASNQRGPLLHYTGTGSMFVGVDTDAIIHDMHVKCPTAEVFNFSESGAGGTKFFRHCAVQVDECTKWGTFTKLQVNLLENSNAINAGTGVTIEGSVSLITSIRELALIGTSATFVGVDLGTSVSGTLDLDHFLPVNATTGAIGFKGLGDANMVAGARANIVGCNFNSVDIPLSGLSVNDDVRFKYVANAGIADTQPDALIYMNANATATVTPTTPTLVAGSWTEARASHFTTTAAGRITLDSEIPVTTPIDIAATVDPASGTNKDITMYVAKNGTEITGSQKTVRVDAGNPQEITVQWQDGLVSGDYLEVFIKESSVNITVVDITFRVR